MSSSNAELWREWEERVAAFRSSGQTGAAWCATNNIKPHQLWYWASRFKKVGSATGTPSRWLPVEVGEPESSGGQDSALLVRVGQAAVEVKAGFNHQAFSDVVRILVSLC